MYSLRGMAHHQQIAHKPWMHRWVLKSFRGHVCDRCGEKHDWRWNTYKRCPLAPAPTLEIVP